MGKMANLSAGIPYSPLFLIKLCKILNDFPVRTEFLAPFWKKRLLTRLLKIALVDKRTCGANMHVVNHHVACGKCILPLRTLQTK
jgi:hypothetical protein